MRDMKTKEVMARGKFITGKGTRFEIPIKLEVRKAYNLLVCAKLKAFRKEKCDAVYVPKYSRRLPKPRVVFNDDDKK